MPAERVLTCAAGDGGRVAPSVVPWGINTGTVQENKDAMLADNSDSGGVYAPNIAVLDADACLDESMAHEPWQGGRGG